MSNVLHVCLYNTEPASSAELQNHIRALNFVRLVAEVSSPAELATALQDGGVNLIFFHLDPVAAPVVEIIDQVSTRHPDVALIAISEKTAPDAILAPMRAGCDQFVCKPIDHTDLAAAVGRVASRRLMSTAKSRCICVVGASGGTGATSLACNLALEIGHLSEKECALIDLDFQFGDIATYFDFDPKYSFYDLAAAGDGLDRAVFCGTMTTVHPNVAVMARPQKVDQHEAISPDTVFHAIELSKSIYENTVIDLPRRIDGCTTAALHQADHVLLICQLVVPSVRNAQRFHEILTRSGVPSERIELVANRSDGRAGRVTIKDLQDIMNKPVFATIPNDYQFVARSVDLGKPISSLDANNPVRVAIRKMAKKIIATGHPEALAGQTKKGFFSRLLAK